MLLGLFRRKSHGQINDPRDAVLEASNSAMSLLLLLTEKFATSDIQELYLNHEGHLSCLKTGGERFRIGAICSTNNVADLVWNLAWDSGVRLDPFCPFAGGILKHHKVRWHAAIPPAAPAGPMLVLRKQSFDVVDLSSFEFENFSDSTVLQWQKRGISVVFFGSTGCGKTTLLCSLLRRYFLECRVGIVESVIEMPLDSPTWFRLVQVGQDVAGRGGVGFERLVAEILRLSPEAIVLGEIRGEEAYLWAELSRSGHGGIFTTFHAGSAAEARSRLYERVNTASKAMPPVMGIHVARDQFGAYRCRAESLNPYLSRI